MTAAAGVVEQDAVALGRQHLGVPGGTLAVAVAAVHEQDGRAVARRAVPAGELQAVARAERDLLVLRAGLRADRRRATCARRSCPWPSGRARRTSRGPRPARRAAAATSAGGARGGTRRARRARALPRSASTPVRSLCATPSTRMCWTCMAPLTVASTANVNAVAARSAALILGKAQIAATAPASAISAASACCPSPSPGCRPRNASSSAWTRATAVAPVNTPRVVIRSRALGEGGAGFSRVIVCMRSPFHRIGRRAMGRPLPAASQMRRGARRVAAYCASAQPSLRGSLPAARTPSACRRTTCAPPVGSA